MELGASQRKHRQEDGRRVVDLCVSTGKNKVLTRLNSDVDVVSRGYHVEGHVLVVREEWVERVLSSATYYTGLRAARGWRPGDMVILVARTELGQSIVGYGIISRIRRREEFEEEEEVLFKEHGWDTAIELEPLVPVKPPIPVEETPLAGLGVRGRYLHGRKITGELLEAMMDLLR